MTVAVYCARAGYDIRCNSINPGAIDTPLLHASFAQAENPEAASRRSWAECRWGAWVSP